MGVHLFPFNSIEEGLERIKLRSLLPTYSVLQPHEGCPTAVEFLIKQHAMEKTSIPYLCTAFKLVVLSMVVSLFSLDVSYVFDTVDLYVEILNINAWSRGYLMRLFSG